LLLIESIASEDSKRPSAARDRARQRA